MVVEDTFQPLTRSGLRKALRSNLTGLIDGTAEGDEWTGLAALKAYTERVLDLERDGQKEVLAGGYVLGWPLQAHAFLHSELLKKYGLEWDDPDLRDLGARTRGVATAWSGFRVLSAHLTNGFDLWAADQLPTRLRLLVHAYERYVTDCTAYLSRE